MFKVICLLKRRDGMALEEFRDYYESRHAVLAKEVIPGMRRYVRRYIRPEDIVLYTPAATIDFDVITELWFDDKASYEKAMAGLTDPAIQARLVEDEMQLFDRKTIRRFSVEEIVSDM